MFLAFLISFFINESHIRFLIGVGKNRLGGNQDHLKKINRKCLCLLYGRSFFPPENKIITAVILCVKSFDADSISLIDIVNKKKRILIEDELIGFSQIRATRMFQSGSGESRLPSPEPLPAGHGRRRCPRMENAALTRTSPCPRGTASAPLPTGRRRRWPSPCCSSRPGRWSCRRRRAVRRCRP